nr:uncharacterized protein LOC121469901 isoform X1 [Taeniopygia guttata]
MPYYPVWWNLWQPRFIRAEDYSAVLVMGNNEEEQSDNDEAQPAGPASPPASEDEDSELLEVHGQERRNVTPNSQEQVDGPGNGTGANDAPVADSAPEEQGAEEEDTQNPDSLSSSAQQGVVIRCPICMESYSEVRIHPLLSCLLCGRRKPEGGSCTSQLDDVGCCGQLAGSTALAVKLHKSLLGECRGRSPCQDGTGRSVGPS